MTNERWRPIDGFPLYEVSDQGRVRSFHTWGQRDKPSTTPRLLTVRPIWSGYLHVTLVRGEERHKVSVHRLVALAFVAGRSGDRDCVDHVDFNRANNVATNLRWVTHAENSAAVAEAKHLPFGEKHHNTSLTADDVRSIRTRNAESATALGAEFGVSRTTIRNIWLRKVWAHVNAPVGAQGIA